MLCTIIYRTAFVDACGFCVTQTVSKGSVQIHWDLHPDLSENMTIYLYKCLCLFTNDDLRNANWRLSYWFTDTKSLCILFYETLVTYMTLSESMHPALTYFMWNTTVKQSQWIHTNRWRFTSTFSPKMQVDAIYVL